MYYETSSLTLGEMPALPEGWKRTYCVMLHMGCYIGAHNSWRFLGYLLMTGTCLRFGAFFYLFASIFTGMPAIFLLIASLLYHSGVDFKVKYVNLGGKKLKLAIWDTGNSIHDSFLSKLEQLCIYANILIIMICWQMRHCLKEQLLVHMSLVLK